MTVPVFGSIPPHPDIVSLVTRASPCAEPPTTFRPRKTIMGLIESSRPFPCDGRFYAVLQRAEPGLHTGDSGQVMRLLGGVRCDHFGSSRHQAGNRRARV